MRSKALIYSAFSILLLTLSSCDPEDARYPAYCYSLIINNDLGYPVSLYCNFDTDGRGGIYAEGDMEHYICYPQVGFFLFSDNYLPKTNTPFEYLWNRYDKQNLKCKLYRMNPDTSEDEELLAEWGCGSPFFNEDSWSLESYQGYYHNETELITICQWTFSLADNL